MSFILYDEVPRLPASPRSPFVPVRKHRSSSPPPDPPVATPRASSTHTTLAPSHVHNVPFVPHSPLPPLETPRPAIKARVTPSATPRKKHPLLPGAERADMPPPKTVQRAKSALALAASGRKPVPPRLELTRAAPLRPEMPSAPSGSSSYLTAGQLPGLGQWDTRLNGLGISSPSTTPLSSASSSAASALTRPSEEVPTGKQENVLVCVRVRPPASKLASGGGTGGGDHAWDANPSAGSVTLRHAPTTSFNFDAVVQSTNNEDVYNQAGRGLVFAAMEGYDAVVFAYGQTASGKTFTLSGTKVNPGIIPLSVQEIFSYIRDHPERDYLLRASYLEIYNETLRDLLAPPSASTEPPKIRQDAERKFFVHPLREEVVTGEAQVEALLRRGGENRSVGGTDFNETSSRSHVVFQITIESRNEAPSATSSPTELRAKTPNAPRLAGGSVRMSRLSLIDLAGSEGATSQAERRAEGAFINKSLLTLEKVIKSLTEMGEGKKPQHVPYRDSKLTQILQPSLSGSARVSVIATLNPSLSAIEETKSTLKFAQRVKKVVLKAKVVEVVDDKALITKYRDHIAVLEQQLKEAMEGAHVPATPSRKPRESIVDGLQHQIEDIRALFVNSANVESRRRSLLPPRPVSPIKLSSDADEQSYEDRFYEQVDKNSILADENEDLKLQLAELTSATPSSSVDERIAALVRENNELRVVVMNGEAGAGAEVRRLERQLEKCRVYEEGLQANLAAERKRIAQFEKFILQHLSIQSERLTGRRRSSLAFTSSISNQLFPGGGIMCESPDLDAISPDFVDLDDLEFSEEGRKKVQDAVVRSTSTLKLEE